MTGDIDLGDLARAYRFRPPTPGTLERARGAVTGIETGAGWCIDVGSGPGAHAAEWAKLGHRSLAVDPSEEMVAVAAGAFGSMIDVVRGRAEALPIRSGIAALTYAHLVIHHTTWRRAIDEMVRVTAPRGRLEVWSFDPSAMPRSALATWFPSIGAIDATRFPPIADIAERLAGSTMSVEVDDLPEKVERTAGSWVEAVRNRFVSTIQLIDDDELAEGIEHFVSAYPDPDEPYVYTIEFTRIRAVR